MNRTLLAKVGLAAALAATLAARPAAAQTFTWTGANDLGWNSGFNWSPLAVPNSATANVNFTGLGTWYGVNISANVSAEHLTFSNPTLGYTLTSNAGVSLSGVVSITVAAGVTGVQTINLANIATGSLRFPVGNILSITNSSTAAGTTLVIGPNTVIGTPGSGGVIVDGPGTTQISGQLGAPFPNNVAGGLYKNGGGTLTLSNPTNVYGGGTFVNAGTLILGSGTAIPTGSNVTVASGAQFNIGNLSNSAATAIGTLTVNGTGTFRVPSGNGDYNLNQLQMTGGTVDFTDSGTGLGFWLRFRNAGAAITTNASATTATWIGAGTSRIQNDTAGALLITVNSGSTTSGIDLDAGIILSNEGTDTTFVKSGAGTMRLTSLGNTANILVIQGRLRVDDLATGGVGALGSGAITFSGGTLQYGGPSATTSKNLRSFGAEIQVLTPGVNLHLNGVISETGGLTISGPGAGGASSTLTLGANNSYSGPTKVIGNAVLSISTITVGGVASPIGSSSAVTGNLLLGDSASRGTLLYTGGTTSTNRGATVTGSYASGAGGAIGVQNAATNLTVFGPGQITGTGSLIKTGAGTLTLTGTTSSYTGGTYVEQGTLNVGASGAVIPANSNVTVSAGATFQVGFTFNGNSTAPLGTMTLNGSTFRVPSGTADYFLNKLVMTGGSVDFTGASEFYLHLTGAGAAITTNASPITATWVGSGNSQIQNETLNQLTITVFSGTTASGIDLESGVRLNTDNSNSAFVKAGLGTMRLTNLTNTADFVVQQGALRVDDVTTNGVGPLGSQALTLNGGRLAYGGATSTLSKPFTVEAAGGGLDVLNAGTTLTVASPIVSNGVLNKSGPGVLVLNNLANTYIGGIAVSGGRLDVSNDAQLGTAAVAVHPFGTLRYTANATTTRTFTLTGGTLEAPAGVTLTLNGAAVAGGFLRGAGAFSLTGGAVISGATTFTGTTVTQTGPAALANVTNGGAFTNAAGQTLVWNGGTNTSSGRLIVNGIVNATDFASNGQLAVNPGGTLNHFGSDLVLGGGSVTTVGSYNPVNGAVTSGGTIALGANNLVVQGGFLRNNGTITGTGKLIVDFGGVAKGAGDYDTGGTILRNGGVLLAGNSPGLQRNSNFAATGPATVGGDLNNATGTVGGFAHATNNNTNASGWSAFEFGNSTNTASGLTLQRGAAGAVKWQFRTTLNDGIGDTPGNPANFSANSSYSWLIFRPRTNADAANPNPTQVSDQLNTVATITLLDAAGNTLANTNANLNQVLVFDATQFRDPATGVAISPSAGTFQFVFGSDLIGRPGTIISLTYTPVPEPATILGFAGLAVAGAGWLRRRRNRTYAQPRRMRLFAR